MPDRIAANHTDQNIYKVYHDGQWKIVKDPAAGLLLYVDCEGAEGSQVWTDESTDGVDSPRAVYANGLDKYFYITQSTPGIPEGSACTWKLSYSDTLYTALSTDFYLDGDFCLEAYIRLEDQTNWEDQGTPVAITDQAWIYRNGNGIFFGYNMSDGSLFLECKDPTHGEFNFSTGTLSWSSTQWYHVVAQRRGNTFELYRSTTTVSPSDTPLATQIQAWGGLAGDGDGYRAQICANKYSGKMQFDMIKIYSQARY